MYHFPENCCACCTSYTHHSCFLGAGLRLLSSNTRSSAPFSVSQFFISYKGANATCQGQHAQISFGSPVGRTMALLHDIGRQRVPSRAARAASMAAAPLKMYPLHSTMWVSPVRPPFTYILPTLPCCGSKPPEVIHATIPHRQSHPLASHKILPWPCTRPNPEPTSHLDRHLAQVRGQRWLTTCRCG